MTMLTSIDVRSNLTLFNKGSREESMLWFRLYVIDHPFSISIFQLQLLGVNKVDDNVDMRD